METYKITLNEAQAKTIASMIKKEVNSGATLGFEKTMSPIFRNINNAIKAGEARKARRDADNKRWEEYMKDLPF